MKMKTASFRFRIWVTESIFYDDSRYIASASTRERLIDFCVVAVEKGASRSPSTAISLFFIKYSYLIWIICPQLYGLKLLSNDNDQEFLVIISIS